MLIKVALALLGLSLATACGGIQSPEPSGGGSSPPPPNGLFPQCQQGTQPFYAVAVNGAGNCTAINNVCAVDQRAAVAVGKNITPLDLVFACPASSVNPVGLCELGKPVLSLPPACTLTEQ